MAYACSSCDAEFGSAAAISQHVGLHHNTCAECDEQFDDVDGLRDHIHETH
jgi:DNA-directed RNA polymerase subunit RPC12/RpoP